MSDRVLAKTGVSDNPAIVQIQGAAWKIARLDAYVMICNQW
ncbi:hypothetical protein QZJ86_13585 [Methylomonas montana]|nr:hypothetical protein [Methylomonas montana]WKJ89054.1 hypothetical protein QZJ86_13585 [Methylomonas montana]